MHATAAARTSGPSVAPAGVAQRTGSCRLAPARGVLAPAVRSAAVHLAHAPRLASRDPAERQQVAVGAASFAAPMPVPQEPQQAAPKLTALGVLRWLAPCALGFATWGFISSVWSGSCVFACATLAQGAAGNQGAIKSGLAGLAAGFLHTLCGPDHLVALTPLTIGRGRAAASALGALWGFGHSTGQFMLGLAAGILKERFDKFVPFLDQWAPFVVAFTLIAIGGLGIYETFFEDEEDDHDHDLPEELTDGTIDAAKEKARFAWATYSSGIVFGLQPDALFVVLPALALPSRLATVAYCLMFVVGTCSAMGGYTAIIGTTSQALCQDKPWLEQNLSTVASAVAMLLGVAVLLAALGIIPSPI